MVFQSPKLILLVLYEQIITNSFLLLNDTSSDNSSLTLQYNRVNKQGNFFQNRTFLTELFKETSTQVLPIYKSRTFVLFYIQGIVSTNFLLISKKNFFWRGGGGNLAWSQGCILFQHAQANKLACGIYQITSCQHNPVRIMHT